MRRFIGQMLSDARQVLLFQARHPDLSPAALASVARLQVLVGVIVGIIAEQARQQEAARAAMGERNRVERLLRDLVAQLGLMFRVLAKHEGVAAPILGGARTRSAPAFVRGVVGVMAAAVEHRDRLLDYGMRAGLLAELYQGLADYRAIEARREGSLAAALQGSAAMEEAGEEASRVIFHLDALNRIRFAGDAERLGEWRVARSTDKADRGADRTDAGAELHPESHCEAPRA